MRYYSGTESTRERQRVKWIWNKINPPLLLCIDRTEAWPDSAMIKLISVSLSGFQRTADNLKVENLFYQQKRDKKSLYGQSLPFPWVLRLKNLSKEKWSKGNFYNLMIKGKFCKAFRKNYLESFTLLLAFIIFWKLFFKKTK